MTGGDNVQERQKEGRQQQTGEKHREREREGEFTLTAMIDQILLIGT